MTTSFTDKKAVTTVSPEARDAWFKWQLTPPVPTSWELPEEARAEIVDADYSDTTDKEELIEKIEDLTAQHAKEKEALQAQLKRKSDDYEAQAKVLTTQNERINHLDLELAKKTKAIETQTPEQRGDVLREEAAEISYKAEAVLRGQVWTPFEALTAHTEATGIDHKQFMSGVLAKYIS